MISDFPFWEDKPFGILIFTILNVHTICNKNVIYKKPTHIHVTPAYNNMPSRMLLIQLLDCEMSVI